MDDLITIQEAQRRIADAVVPLGAEQAPLLHALGRTLAAAVPFKADMPPFDRAMMDGYAVRAGDVAAAAPQAPVVLRETGQTVFAGDLSGAVCPQGGAVRTMTGAPVPDGADAVVRLEFTERGAAGTVRILRPVPAGEAVQSRGFGGRAGDEIAPAGVRVDALTLATLAAHGHADIRVMRRPRVALAAIGSELTAPGGAVQSGQLYDSNSSMLHSLVLGWGGEPLPGGVCPDSLEEMASRLAALWERADVLVTTGGVSVGDGDLTPRAFLRLGARSLFQGVWMRPGTPVCAFEKDGKIALALSGNPGAAYVNAILLMLPLLYRLTGRAQYLQEHVVTARLVADPGKRTTRHARFLRGQLTMRDATLWIDPGLGQSPAIPHRLGAALAVIAPGETAREGVLYPVIVEQAWPLAAVGDEGLARDALRRYCGV